MEDKEFNDLISKTKQKRDAIIAKRKEIARLRRIYTMNGVTEKLVQSQLLKKLLSLDER